MTDKTFDLYKYPRFVTLIKNALMNEVYTLTELQKKFSVFEDDDVTKAINKQIMELEVLMQILTVIDS